jgi:hypothetical protein
VFQRLQTNECWISKKLIFLATSSVSLKTRWTDGQSQGCRTEQCGALTYLLWQVLSIRFRNAGKVALTWNTGKRK